jgi:hypothetical protein
MPNAKKAKKPKAAKATTVVPGLPAHIFAAAGFPSIAVPAGKHLVVETISVQVDVTPPATKIAAFVDYTCGGISVTLFVPLTYTYTDPGTHYDFYVALQAVRLYADPGTSLTVKTYSPGGSSGTLFLTVSGYLV